MKTLTLFAVSHPGLEQILLREVRELGVARAKAGEEEGGVTFRGGLRELYRANLHLRTASRVLVRVSHFHAAAFHELERNAKRVRWSDFLSAESRVTLRVTCRKSKLYHSDAVGERIGQAIVKQTGATLAADAHADADGEDTGARDSGARNQLFVVRFFRDECTISADSSGASLHVRGYREALAKAPMRETLAAALIHASGWRAERALMDPMCGAGTIPIEAALMARKIAPGLACADRKPRFHSFERWAGHDRSIWDAEVNAARGEILARSPVPIVASDRDAGAVEATVANARRAGVETDLEVSRSPLSAIVAAADHGTLVINPPYGKRLGAEKPLRDLYARLGAVVRTGFSGWDLAMLSGSNVLDRQTGLRLETVARTSNGGIPVRIVRSSGE